MPNHSTFHLYWLRETGCDAGTPITAAELPAPIRDRVLELARNNSGAAAPATFQLRLPFADRLEEKRPEQFFASMALERTGDLIRAVLDPAAATRDMAATCAFTDPLWRGVPPERDPEYFPTWQRVSMALQRWLRDQVATRYFRDPACFQDMPDCYPVIVYQAARPFFGKPRTDFTYDLRDFPWCQDTLEASWKLTGRGLQRVLAGIEAQLLALGDERLARRYSPVWFEDVLAAVRRKPKAYADLLARESAIINSVIDLGTQPKAAEVSRVAKTINQRLRKMHGEDMRALGCGLFEEATRALAASAQKTSGDADYFGDMWPLENPDVLASGRPDARVRC